MMSFLLINNLFNCHLIMQLSQNLALLFGYKLNILGYIKIYINRYIYIYLSFNSKCLDQEF
jgi:hypothetical protein